MIGGKLNIPQAIQYLCRESIDVQVVNGKSPLMIMNHFHRKITINTPRVRVQLDGSLT